MMAGRGSTVSVAADYCTGLAVEQGQGTRSSEEAEAEAEAGPAGMIPPWPDLSLTRGNDATRRRPG